MGYGVFPDYKNLREKKQFSSEDSKNALFLACWLLESWRLLPGEIMPELIQLSHNRFFVFPDKETELRHAIAAIDQTIQDLRSDPVEGWVVPQLQALSMKCKQKLERLTLRTPSGLDLLISAIYQLKIK